MSQIIPIYIPTFISDQNFNPSRVLPHVYFYNGLIDCEQWWFESGSLTTTGVGYPQTSFPYFDNYNVVSGSFPTLDSDSLLFNNENAVYGQIPTGSLYTNYWETYVSLLYNPKTRLLTAEAIIPLADYVKMELNDVVNFRGNYYHLRAINDYSLKTGECTLQLLGPIIQDTISDLQPQPTPPVTQSYGIVSWSFTESNGANGSFRVYDGASNIATLTANGSGNAKITSSHTVNVEMDPVSWVAGTSMSLNVNGGFTSATSSYINQTITSSFQVSSGSIYYITGSITYNATSSVTCCAPSNVSASVNGGNLDIYFNTGSVGCDTCLATRTQLSLNGSTWDTPISTSCTSPNVITLPTSSVYIRMYQICVTGSVTSSFSNTYYFSSGSGGGTATLDWSFSITGGPTATMDIYKNASILESRNYTSSGTNTVSVGDVIYVDINMSGCSGGNNTANAYTLGIIADAGACSVGQGTTSLSSYSYTVQPGDVGNTLSLDCFALCDSACV
jgi:hypothetical protein